MDAVEMRRLGAEILAPVLTSHGFLFEPGGADQGSGGLFARGAFVRGDRRLAFSARYHLGEVVYHVRHIAIAHEDLMRAVAPAGKGEYPGFSDDPLDGFRRLARDLQAFGAVFLGGSDADFAQVAERARELIPPTGVARLSRPSG